MNVTRVAILPSGVERLAEAVAGGFTHVELEAMEQRPQSHLEALADAGVFVACVRLSGALHVADVRARRAAFAGLKRQWFDAARLGAPTAYLRLGHVAEAQRAYCVEGCRLLAELGWVHLLVGPMAPSLGWLRAACPDFGRVVEGDEIEEARQAAGTVPLYVRRPGKRLEDALHALPDSGWVAVEPHSPHTSSSTSSAT